MSREMSNGSGRWSADQGRGRMGDEDGSGFGDRSISGSVGLEGEDTAAASRRESGRRGGSGRSDEVVLGALEAQVKLEEMANAAMLALMAKGNERHDVKEVARWQAIVRQCRSNIQAIYDQGRDPDIYVRMVEMMVEHLNTQSVEERVGVGDVLEPFLKGFEKALRSGEVRPV